MNKKATVTVLSLVGFILVSTAFTALNVVAERSLTLARVREADFQLISLLLEAANFGESKSIDTRAVGEAFDTLGPYRSDVPRIGLVLEKEGNVIASNLDSQSVEQLLEQLELDPTVVETSNLGNGVVLTGVLIDRKYFDETSTGSVYWRDWHSFLTVPYQQFIDGRGVSLSLIFRKAEGPLFAMLLVGIVFLMVWVVWLMYTKRRIATLEEKNENASHRVEDLEGRLDKEHLERKRLRENRDRMRRDLQNAENQLSELQSVIKNSQDPHNLRDGDQTGLEYELNRLIGERNQYRVELTQWEEMWEEADSKISELEKELENEHSEKTGLEAKLNKLQMPKKTSTELLLRRIWNVDWHSEAQKDAINLYVRSGQPGERRHLSELLHEVHQLKAHQPDNGKWTPFKTHPTYPIWHNGGKKQAKLYWANVRNKSLVLAVATGKDEHQKYDGGDILRKRLDSVLAGHKKAA